jgi:hypothetical protein
MPRRWTSIAKLPASEQRAIGWLRGNDRYELGRDSKREFRQLRQAAEGVGMYIPTSQSPYLSVDEAGLLAWLMLFQRQKHGTETNLDETLRGCLLRCAVRLDRAGTRLPYRSVEWNRTPGNALKLQPVPASLGPQKGRSLAMPRVGSLQVRALRFISGRGAVSTQELQRFGASRQVISIMFKRGLLRRVRFGVYAAAPEAVVRLGAAQ